MQQKRDDSVRGPQGREQHKLSVRHAQRPGFFLAQLDDYPEVLIRNDRLLRLKRFRNVIWHQYGVTIPHISREDWERLVTHAVWGLEGGNA